MLTAIVGTGISVQVQQTGAAQGGLCGTVPSSPQPDCQPGLLCEPIPQFAFLNVGRCQVAAGGEDQPCREITTGCDEGLHCTLVDTDFWTGVEQYLCKDRQNSPFAFFCSFSPDPQLCVEFLEREQFEAEQGGS